MGNHAAFFCLNDTNLRFKFSSKVSLIILPEYFHKQWRRRFIADYPHVKSKAKDISKMHNRKFFVV
ncbi:hypothetical protein ABID22_000029 [Pontibacter aydingkolensis]